MADLLQIFEAIDRLRPDELEQVRRYIEQRSRTTAWVVSPDNLAAIEALMQPVHEEAAQMSEDEINRVIDEAIAEVRHERKQDRRSP